MASKVRYERVNLADIDTSSDDDDYGDLFAAERARGKGGKMGGRKKGGRCSGRCLRGSCLLLSVTLTLALLAGVALYLDILKPLHISYFNDRGNHTHTHNHTLHNHTLHDHTLHDHTFHDHTVAAPAKTTDNATTHADTTSTTLAQATQAAEATTSKDTKTTQLQHVTEKVVTVESEEDGNRSTWEAKEGDESRSTWLASSFGQPSVAQTSFGDNYSSVGSYSGDGSQ